MNPSLPDATKACSVYGEKTGTQPRGDSELCNSMRYSKIISKRNLIDFKTVDYTRGESAQGQQFSFRWTAHLERKF
jgi:hypothetical protein